MEEEPKMATSSAIPMPYIVSETDETYKKDEKVVNKNVKHKNRKRNKGNLVIENDDDDDDPKNV